MAMPRRATTKSATDEEQKKKPANGEHNGEGMSEALVVTKQDVTEWTPRFVQGVDEAVALEQAKVEFMNRVMKEDEHYGKIPGGGKKPVLLKPGAEKLNASMGLHPVLMDAEPPIRDYTGEGHGGQPFWSFRRVCRIYRQTGPTENDRMLIAQAEGSCNSYEVKYRYRDEQRKCPVCGQPSVFQSKGKKDGTSNKEELGFFCWSKKGGCGANFRHDDHRITDQKTGRALNMDVMDLENTGLKMADKRALVAATLLATGFSAHFTQDLEDRAGIDPDSDMGGGYDGYVPSARSAPPPAPPPPPPPAPKKEETPEEAAAKLRKQVASKLAGEALAPYHWERERFAEANKVLDGDVGLLIGTLVELHMKAHGALCAHITTIPEAVDYRYPAEESHRKWVDKLKAEIKEPEPVGAAAGDGSIDSDDIPF